MYKLLIAKKVKKFIAAKPRKEQIRIVEKFELLQRDPFAKELDVKPFQSKLENCYRLRIGQNRFVYELKNDELVIKIFDGNKRGDVY